MSGPKKPTPLSQGQKSIASFFTPSQRQKRGSPVVGRSASQAAVLKASDPTNDSAALDAGCLHPLPDGTPSISVKRPAQQSEQTPVAGSFPPGRRIKVHWPAEGAWFEGEIKQVSSRGSINKALVLYDDGDEEWIVEGKHKYELVADQPAAKKARLQRTVVEDSNSELEPSSGSEFNVSEAEDDSDESLDLEGSDVEEDVSEDEEGITDKPGKVRRPGKTVSKATTSAVTPFVSKHMLPPATPGTGLRAHPGNGVRLARALETPGIVTPSRPTEEHGSALKSALSQEGAPPEERFGSRAASRFAFLQPDKIMDAARRRPSDPGYDPTTLFIPPNWFREHKISEGQKQWWGFKSRNFDAVLLFKMGKFYEMFEMDAHVGVSVLGLSYMKGDQPHAGFPEAAYPAMAAALARAGHKVAVIEQTETPEGLAARNARRTPGQKKESVVRRDKVAVLTPGTLVDADMVACTPNPVWLLCLYAAEADERLQRVVGSESNDCAVNVPVDKQAPGRSAFGAVAVDVAGACLRVGSWTDDPELLSGLRGLLCTLRPSEVVLAGERIGSRALRVVRGMLPDARLVDRARSCADEEDIDQENRRSVARLMERCPSSIRQNPVTLGALRLAAGYLHETMVADQVFELGEVEELTIMGSDSTSESTLHSRTTTVVRAPTSMALDAAALENLEILEGSDGTPRGSLLASIDHCATPGGRACLRAWLGRPLFDPGAIRRRQDAVAALMGARSEAGAAARKLLAGLTDARRAVVRLTASGLGVGSARDAPHVVLYEDTARRRVRAVATTLRTLRQIQRALDVFRCSDFCESDSSSDLLDELTTPGRALPSDLDSALSSMLGATDWEAAESSGSVVPAPGVDAAYDAAGRAVLEADRALDAYLEEIKGDLGIRQATFVSVAKESHVIQVPEGTTVPREWEPVAGKKGVRRYVTQEVRQLVKRREEAHSQREAAQAGILMELLKRFAEHKDIWLATVECASQLDALLSLAIAASTGGAGGSMCRPEILAWDDGAVPVFRAMGLRHPVAAVVEAAAGGGAFVPNDIVLGGLIDEADQSAPLFQVLTGPNMGGKSTLMRQVCLAAVLAQIGAWVPAERLVLTPADALFVRMGARDRILLGQSTFFVEMAETSAALAGATRASIVALDELGRGTATSDGSAIAEAVLEHLAGTVRCRGLFATHYHSVAEEALERLSPGVGVSHMACRVDSDHQGSDRVTFLYKVVKGVCPSSYGVNVARLAGIPDKVVSRASDLAKALEKGEHLDQVDCAARGKLASIVRQCDAGLDGARQAARMLVVP